MSGSSFEVIDHTADIGIRACGSTLGGLFAAAARGMTDLIVDGEAVREVVTSEIKIRQADPEEMLVAWLNQLLYEFEVNGLVFHDFEVSEMGSAGLTAACRGEKLDRARHNPRREIKAATYHNLVIENSDGKYTVTVIFDI